MKLIKFIFIFAFLLLSSPAWAATYYVTQNGGTAPANGSDYTHSMSIGTHNASSFSGDDIIYLCDTITSSVYPPSSGTSGHYITYSGAYSGHAGTISGGVYGIHVYGKDYLVFQDITITGSSGAGIMIREGADYVTVKRCTVHDVGSRGIFITWDTSGSRISCTYITIGGASGDGNSVYNTGIDTADADMDVSNASHFEVSYNQFYGVGADGIVMANAHYGTVIYNTIHDKTNAGAEDGVDCKEGSTYVEIAYNHIYNMTKQAGITMQASAQYINIHHNLVHDVNWFGIGYQIPTNGAAYGNGVANDIDIWNNIIYNATLRGICIYSWAAGNPEPLSDVRIYNNVISSSGSSNDTNNTGIWLGAGTNITVKNNILYKNRPGKTDYRQAYVSSGPAGTTTWQNNIAYWPGGHTSKIYWVSGDVNWASVGSNNTDEDPAFTNAASNIYTLESSSPAIDAGQNLTDAYDDALDPINTNFSTSPPTVVLLDQDDYGDGWERGAYVYYSDLPSNLSLIGVSFQ